MSERWLRKRGLPLDGPPNPKRIDGLPFWEELLTITAAAASVGLLPEHTLAFGVEVYRDRLVYRFELSEVTPEDEEDTQDIEGDFFALGPWPEHVEIVIDVKDAPSATPEDGVRWIYIRRQ
jgi:hypothetical protein